jgi:hypothetical protein
MALEAMEDMALEAMEDMALDIEVYIKALNT